jgi:AICAR transformylase/IMP cyclohydrolase PurH
MASSGIDLPDEPGLPGAADPFPASLTIGLEKVETVRYGENPHQPAARYRRAGVGLVDGPFRDR